MSYSFQNPPVTQAAVRKRRADRVQKVTVACGVEAWLVEDYAVPIVAVDLAFNGGGSQDDPGKAGTANMFSALLNEGAGDMDSQAFHRSLDDSAVELHFSADRDAVTGQMRSLQANLPQAFRLLGLALNVPRFDEDAIERIRGQASAGLKLELNDPDSLAAKMFRAKAFASHPYSLPLRGELETLPRIKQADHQAMHKAQFARDNVKIGVVGAINVGQLADYLDEAFGSLPLQAHLKPLEPAPFEGVGTQQFADLDVSQSTIRFGRPGIGRHDPDFIAAMVTNHILGGSAFTSRLFLEVREKRGLAYSVYSQLAHYDHADFLLGATTTKNERALESLAVIQEQIRQLARQGASAEELGAAKNYLIGSYALRFDTSAKIAHQMTHLQVDGFDVSYLDERNRLIDAVTLADIQRAGERLLGNGDLLVTIVGRPVV